MSRRKSAKYPLTAFFIFQLTNTPIKKIINSDIISTKATEKNQNVANIMNKYDWPGNVRQLQNVVKRLGLTSREHEISLTEVEQSLENQPEMQGSFSQEGSEKIGITD